MDATMPGARIVPEKYWTIAIKPRPTLLRERLKAFRLHAGLTQPEVAKRTGIAQSAISAYERGTRRPAAAYCRALDAVYGLDPGTISRLAWEDREYTDVDDEGVLADVPGPSIAVPNIPSVRRLLLALKPLDEDTIAKLAEQAHLHGQVNQGRQQRPQDEESAV